MTRYPPARSRPPRTLLPWFLAWAAVGLGFGLVVSVIGIFAVPLALLATALLIIFHHADRSALGILTGVGLVLLFVAYVQRRGPGTVTWHTATASGSDTYLDPRPWLAAGVVLVAIGVGAFVWQGRHPRS
jgi:hypothetical protein